MNKKIPTKHRAWADWSGWLIALLVAACVLALTGCESGRDDSDPPYGRSGMVPRTDALTGCQYMTYSGNGFGAAITPRLDRDGKQVCK